MGKTLQNKGKLLQRTTNGTKEQKDKLSTNT